MTILEMMIALEACGDLTVSEQTNEKGIVYHVTVEDWDGFDEDWNEIDREFENEDLVDKFLEALENQTLLREGDFYKLYHFDNYQVYLGWASFEI